MNHAARPLAFSYVRRQGRRGITIRTGRESPAQDSPAGSHPPQAKPNVRIMPRWVRVRVRVTDLPRLRSRMWSEKLAEVAAEFDGMAASNGRCRL